VTEILPERGRTVKWKNFWKKLLCENLKTNHK
jgi:hypothetical protein